MISMPFDADPYLQASTSRRSRLGRVLWAICHQVLFRPSPRPLHAWRALLLRLFGARLGRDCHIYPGSRIWAPWNLECEDVVAIADGAIVYNAAPIRLGSHSVISQEAFLCAASHDLDDAEFPMITASITIGRRAWIGARATVCPGITVAEGAVLGLGGVATKDLDAWTVYAGVPARPIRPRRHVSAS
jgi:putative colanic acid biosynthesis acetyltransferase WcaF